MRAEIFGKLLEVLKNWHERTTRFIVDTEVNRLWGLEFLMSGSIFFQILFMDDKQFLMFLLIVILCV